MNQQLNDSQLVDVSTLAKHFEVEELEERLEFDGWGGGVDVNGGSSGYSWSAFLEYGFSF